MESAGLDIVANKPPIVATHVGSFGHRASEDAIARYEREASTHVRLSQIQDYERRLIDAVLSRQTSIGCLVAPFGYGKTSTAIDIWKSAEEAGILAIPPFSCNSIAQMGEVVASAAIMRLSTTAPKAVGEIQAAYDEYLVTSAKRMAQQDSDEYQIEYKIALRSIQDKIERGHLLIEASSTSLLAFLEEAVDIVTNAGYGGLLVIVDEFQQFLGTLNKATITSFRTLVWGIKTRNALPFGLAITMDPDTERNLSERAGDILHRIKEDGLYLNFSGIYDREFPRLLWKRYAEAFGFAKQSQSIVDRAALEAVGQICERHDLSNGPRTVINAFQRIAASYQSRLRPYTPLDLVDDFLTGDIKFDGDGNKVASLVTELTSYDYIAQVPARVDTLKLISAFPRGCSREVAEAYGLESTFDQLVEELRGEILTQLPGGIALIDLQRVGKPQNKLNIILKKYWMQITEEQIIADRILPLFARLAIESLFPPFRNVLAGWRRVEEEFALTPLGGYLQIYEGTFFEEYPSRRVSVQVCKDIGQAVDVQELDKAVDVDLVFVLYTSRDASKFSKYYSGQRTIAFHIPIAERFDRPLPRDIRWIEDYLSPVVITPGVLLSLIDYIERKVPTIEGMTETEQLRISDVQHKLLDFLILMLFDESLFSWVDVPVISRGSQAVRDVLFHLFNSLYPQYQTLITTPYWESTLKAYASVLESLTLSQRRGLEPLAEAKAAIASRFGYRKHAGFESRAKQFTHLLTVQDWAGDQGKLILTQHPGEVHLLNAIAFNREAGEGISEAAVLREGREAGYTSTETSYLLQFLLQRGQVQKDVETGYFRLANTPLYQELDSLVYYITQEIDLIQSVFNDEHLSDMRQEVGELARRLEDSDERLYDEIQVRLLESQHTLHEVRESLKQRLAADLTSVRNQLYDLLECLKQGLPVCETGLVLDTHVNGVQRTLIRKHGALLERLSATAEPLGAFLKRPLDLEVVDLQQLQSVLASYEELLSQATSQIEEAESCVSQAQLHREWVSLIEQLRRLFDYCDVAAQLTDVTRLKKQLNEAVDGMGRDLATIGLKGYGEIYNTYSPMVQKLAAELDIATRLVRLAESDAADEISVNWTDAHGELVVEVAVEDEENERESLMQLLQYAEHMTISELIAKSHLSPGALLYHLMKLEGSGRVKVDLKLITDQSDNRA